MKSISSANGRVFEWISPVNGIKQGDYEPVVLLVSPKKKQGLSIGTNYKLGEKTLLKAETAFSLNDLNTFSSKNAEDDYGMATNLNLEHNIIANETNKLSLAGGYQFVHKHFNEIENFREQEFTRDWNIGDLGIDKGEHLANLGIKYKHKNNSFADYEFGVLQRPALYSGFRNKFSSNLNFKKWNIYANANYISSNDTVLNSKFLRHKAGISRDFNEFRIGISEEAEDNSRILQNSQAISDNSFSWNAFKAFVSSTDSARHNFYLSYSNRTDRFAQFGLMEKSSNVHDFFFSTQLSDKKIQSLNASANYRKLNVYEFSPEGSLPENNLTGRLEYSLRMLKGSLLFSSFYEIGSALERKTEFAYIEVAPGQGVYTWTDYNGNGIQELDEFEIAYYQDQANFIRYYSSTNEYIKAFANQFSQMINFRPSLKWRNVKGFAGFLTKFSNQFAYKVNNKNTSENFFEYVNPFLGNLNDSSLVSLNQSLKSEFSFNKNNPKYGIDYVFNNNSSKMLLVNGFDSRNLLKHEFVGRFSLKSMFRVNNKFALGTRYYASEYFASKNYEIDFIENTFSLSFQPNMQNRLSAIYKWKEKNNKTGIESLISHDAGLEYNLSSVKKGVLSASLNYIFIDYNADSNSPVSYEMLEGLLPGNNITWQINFQRQLANGLQINLNYNGRAASDARTIHTGGVQLRAFF
ncbi:MAG: hypothetical protein GX879_02645 [Bacteroidales bacterium]|nr:hypothetical protein [Bacteroidales bacterium]